jgi:hypothetical protein
MNKKEQKVKESTERPKVEDVKTDRSNEKNQNIKKEKDTKNKENKEKDLNSSIVEKQPLQNKINQRKETDTKNNKNQIKSDNYNGKTNIENNVNQEDQKNANSFVEYLDESGLPEAFQLIFGELIEKKINPQNYFNYVGMRLRQIGKEINEIKNK